MTPYRKKLIEVALPLEAINVASAREKSIRHGHPSTLHLWWARRPLAACRAVLFASLVDDPDSDPAYAHYDAETREHMAGEKRQQLFDLITELVQWENSNNELVINAARAEIARCVASRKIETGELNKDHKLPGGETVYDLVVKGHGDLKKLRENLVRLPKAESVNAFLAEHAPPVLDPFCGGGSIPLEAQRLGLRAYASDLNPVPVLITKALIEIPPKFANKPPVNPESRQMMYLHDRSVKKNDGWPSSADHFRGAKGLAEDVRYYGKWMRDEAEKRIGHLYPRVKITAEIANNRPDLTQYVGEELTVIAWMWVRTVLSPNPAFSGRHVPLASSFWLSTRKGRLAYAIPKVDEQTGTYSFEVKTGPPTDGFNPDIGTVGKHGGRCLISGSPMSLEYIREEGMAGRLYQSLLAVVAEGKGGRVYLAPNAVQEHAAELRCPENIPETELPISALGFRVQRYGLIKHYQLFTRRQLTALVTFSELVSKVGAQVQRDFASTGVTGDAAAYADAVATYIGMSVSRQANRCSSQCFWDQMRENVQQVFARNALPFIWDFCEANPFSDSSGNFIQQLEYPASCLENLPTNVLAGEVRQLDAKAATSTWGHVAVCTDPPYYDNIGYACLSDFFYIWLRESLRSIYPTLFSTLLTPKEQELIAEPARHKSRTEAARFFEEGLNSVFSDIRASAADEIPVPVFYAFRQSESDADDAVASTGWDTFLQGVVTSGWQVVGTLPLRTEQAGGLRVVGRNALASSIVVSLRKRRQDAPLATRREFLNALKHELPVALRHLQRGGIAPVDLAQAAIGPGMAVFTQYAKVMEAEGSPMRVRQALALINQTLDDVLAEQEGEFDGDTRWAVAWFDQFGVEEGSFGVAETLSKAKNTAVSGLAEAGIIHARGGKVRLLRRDELPADWNPATDTRLRHWEIVQYLIRTLETGGESAAADLLRRLGGMGEIARDLAYRLYNICERKGWASEALAYNGLVIAWPEIAKLAAREPRAVRSRTGALFGGEEE